jgi:hypothetical protein
MLGQMVNLSRELASRLTAPEPRGAAHAAAQRRAVALVATFAHALKYHLTVDGCNGPHMAAVDEAEFQASVRGALRQVGETPSWPRSWANFSPLSLYSRRNAWVNLHLLGQPNTFLSFGPARRLARAMQELVVVWGDADAPYIDAVLHESSVNRPLHALHELGRLSRSVGFK